MKIEKCNYIVGFRDLFEFGFSFFLVVRVLVRMPFHGEFSIGFFEVIIFGIAVHLKNLIIVYSHASLLPSSGDNFNEAPDGAFAICVFTRVEINPVWNF